MGAVERIENIVVAALLGISAAILALGAVTTHLWVLWLPVAVLVGAAAYCWW